MDVAKRVAQARDLLPEHVRLPDPARYLSTNYVVLDFETTILHKGKAIYPENSIVLACWSYGPGHPRYRPGASRRHVFGNEYALQELVDAIAEADFLVAHNAKFELSWLARCGLDLASVLVYDTMLGEYVIGGNRWVWAALSLNACAERHFGEHKVDVVSSMIKAAVCCSDIPESWLLYYCRRDVELTERLMHSQIAQMQGTRLLPVVYTRCLLTPCLAEIETHGMTLDGDVVKQRVEELEKEYVRLEAELDEMVDGANLASPIQLRKVIYEDLGFEEVRDRNGKPRRTGTDLPRTDAQTLSMLRPTTAKQREFLALYVQRKEVFNELTKYLRKFSECVAEAGGVLRAEFNQSATQTHRLSSTGMDYNAQLHNIPRAYKPMFRARRPGDLVGEIDGGQLEFRAAAHLGRDRVATEDIVSGRDIHTATAEVIWPRRGGDPDSKHPRRQDAKEHTFKPLYGGRSGSPDEVRYYEYFRERYSGISGAQSRWINTVLAHGKLETEWGLVYYWPDTKMERSGYIKNSTNICNYPVQGFATAEIIPIAVVYLWHYIQVLRASMYITNTVHDSAIMDLPPEEVPLMDELAKVCFIMEVNDYLRNVYDVEMTVPLAAGVSHGERWGDEDAKRGERTYQ